MMLSFTKRSLLVLLACLLIIGQVSAQQPVQPNQPDQRRPGHHPHNTNSYFDIPPRWLIDCPTAGTLPRKYLDVGFRFYSYGGALVYTDFSPFNRVQLGISYGADSALSAVEPKWNPDIEFSIRFRLVDEMEYFPAIAVGYCSQGDGHYDSEYKRYAFKSKGFYLVASRSFYFYKWTSGWHGGINYAREDKVDNNGDLDFFIGMDATFDYNLAYMMEYDFGLNDNKGSAPGPEFTRNYSGKGRGYLNMSFKWLFTENLEMELILKDLFVNRRESRTFTREVRFLYIDHF